MVYHAVCILVTRFAGLDGYGLELRPAAETEAGVEGEGMKTDQEDSTATFLCGGVLLKEAIASQCRAVLLQRPTWPPA